MKSRNKISFVQYISVVLCNVPEVLKSMATKLNVMS